MNLLKSILVAVLLVLAVSACEYDYVPVALEIYVEDAAGNDRLDPASPYFIGSDIYVYYENVEYPMRYDKEQMLSTKAVLTQLDGLQLRRAESGHYYLYFGDLDGSQDYNCAFALHWPDDSLDWIHYRRNVVVLGVVTQSWKFNGKRTGMPMTIVK